MIHPPATRPFSPMRPLFLRSLLLCALFVAAASAAHGQRFNRVEDTKSNVDAYFYHVQPGAATVQVYVLGTVQAPGFYEVSDGTHLGQLLALSGGPTLNARRESSDRKVTIKLYRPAGYGERPLFEALLDEAVTRPSTYPVLRDGDVLVVEIVEKERFNWRDAFSIIGGVSALALAVERIVRLR